MADKITAIFDRLVLTMQDFRAWLKIPLTYTNVDIDIVPDPIEGQIYFVAINGIRAEFVAPPTPTPTLVTAGLKTVIDTLAITDLTVTDNAGSYNLSIVAPATFELYLSTGQAAKPQSADEYLYSALGDVAKTLADEYCLNPFATYDVAGDIEAGSELPIPEPVRAGVLQLFAWLLAEQVTTARAAGTLSGNGETSGAVKRKKVDRIEVEYATAKDSTVTGAAALIARTGLPSIVKSILDLYRFIPGGRRPRTARTPAPGLHNLGKNDSGLAT